MAHHNIELETISESIEMYLLRIALLRTEGQPVPIPTLAQELSISTVSANEMCRRLVDKGLIEYQPYRGVTLTAPAEGLARRVLRNRRLWEVFFVEKLGIAPGEADEIACRFEHVTPDELAGRLATFLGYPDLSPQNEAIPYDDQIPWQEPFRPLATLPVGAKGRVAGVKADEAAYSFLRQHGLTPGTRLEVLAIAADGGLLLEISGQPLSLAKTMAEAVDVTPDNFN
jgi:DtxR family Mn-dependent transcriptional regulator